MIQLIVILHDLLLILKIYIYKSRKKENLKLETLMNIIINVKEIRGNNHKKGRKMYENVGTNRQKTRCMKDFKMKSNQNVFIFN